MSPACQNCGAFVTRDYVRVFAPEGADGPGVCPDCGDKVRGRDGRPRDAHAARQGRFGSESA